MYSLSNEAKDDLDEIWLHIAREDPLSADGVIEYLEERFKALAASPKIGRIRPEFRKDALCFSTGKEKWRSHFLVFYRIEGKTVEIARIIEGHRDITPDQFRYA